MKCLLGGLDPALALLTRPATQTRLRKEKLAKMARSGGESKITKITDFNSLLEEAENQLDRIAGGATMAEGDVRDDAAFASVDAIAKKIDKVWSPSFTGGPHKVLNLPLLLPCNMVQASLVTHADCVTCVGGEVNRDTSN